MLASDGFGAQVREPPRRPGLRLSAGSGATRTRRYAAAPRYPSCAALKIVWLRFTASSFSPAFWI